MLKLVPGALKVLQWLNGTCSMVQWSQPTPIGPLAQTSGMTAMSVLKLIASALHWTNRTNLSHCG